MVESKLNNKSPANLQTTSTPVKPKSATEHDHFHQYSMNSSDVHRHILNSLEHFHSQKTFHFIRAVQLLMVLATYTATSALLLREFLRQNATSKDNVNGSPGQLLLLTIVFIAATYIACFMIGGSLLVSRRTIVFTGIVLVLEGVFFTVYLSIAHVRGMPERHDALKITLAVLSYLTAIVSFCLVYKINSIEPSLRKPKRLAFPIMEPPIPF